MVGTAVFVGVAVAVLVGVAEGVWVAVGVLVGVLVGVFVGVLVGVFVGVLVGALVAVAVGVFVGVGFVGVQLPNVIEAMYVPQRPLVVPVFLLYSPRYQNVTPSGAIVISV